MPRVSSPAALPTGTAADASTPFKFGPKRIQLDIRVLMSKHGYKSVTTLYNALDEMGCDVTYSQFTRIVDNRAGKLNVGVLDALINLFNCDAGDLFKVVTQQD